MTWLDRTLAIPAVGLTHKPVFRSQAEIFAALRSTMDEWAADKKEINIKPGNIATLQFEVSDGTNLLITSTSFTASFSYTTELREQAGALPVLKYGAELSQYSKLLDATCLTFLKLLPLLVPSTGLVPKRMGIVADTNFDATDPPPGVARFLKYFSRPWGGTIEIFDGNIVAVVEDNDDTKTRVHHHVALNDEEERLKNIIKMKLDWQKVHKKDMPLFASELPEYLKSAREAALAYFVRFGQGGFNYGDDNS